MVHLLVYADVLDIEGLISSPFDMGRKEDILRVIDCYEKDCANLKAYSDLYPTPDALRVITKQGETERATYAGVRRSCDKDSSGIIPPKPGRLPTVSSSTSQRKEVGPRVPIWPHPRARQTICRPLGQGRANQADKALRGDIAYYTDPD